VDALPLLETGLALGEDSAEAHFYMAEALAALSPDNTARALGEVTRALELAPDDPYALSLAGRLYLDSAKPAEALRVLQRSVELLPDLAQAHY
jgi:tetratricopeptide (TPR) repeat protein